MVYEKVTVYLINGKSFIDAEALSSYVTTFSIRPKGSKQQYVIPWSSILYMKYEDAE